MRIAMMLMRHPPTKVSPIMPEVVALLSDWGVSVQEIYPEEGLFDLDAVDVENDLYILKSGTDAALSLAGALEAAGARVLNPYSVAATLRDKIIATRIQQLAGIPTPKTYVTGCTGDLSPRLLGGPLIVKPYRGSQGRGIRVVRDEEELCSVETAECPVFAQRYHEPNGNDLKIYCIGGQVFGVRRPWPALTYADKVGEPFAISSTLHEVALAWGRAFGIDLFGIDVIECQDGFYVVDGSSFPGFKGVPDAALRLADYIYAAGLRAKNGEHSTSAAHAEAVI